MLARQGQARYGGRIATPGFGSNGFSVGGGQISGVTLQSEPHAVPYDNMSPPTRRLPGHPLLHPCSSKACFDTWVAYWFKPACSVQYIKVLLLWMLQS